MMAVVMVDSCCGAHLRAASGEPASSDRGDSCFAMQGGAELDVHRPGLAEPGRRSVSSGWRADGSRAARTTRAFGLGAGLPLSPVLGSRGQVHGRADQRQVAEPLREVANLLARRWIDFF